jgi:hypothetical protein
MRPAANEARIAGPAFQPPELGSTRPPHIGVVEMDGRGHLPFSERKMRLERLLAGRNVGIVLNQHFVEKGAVVFAAARAAGFAGIAPRLEQADALAARRCRTRWPGSA